MTSIELIEPKTDIDYKELIKQRTTNVSRYVRESVKERLERDMNEEEQTEQIQHKTTQVHIIQNVTLLVSGMALIALAISTYYGIQSTVVILLLISGGLLLILLASFNYKNETIGVIRET